MTAGTGRRRIVVGVDESGGAREALRWAAMEAQLLGAGIDVVHTWQVPVVVYPEGQVFDREPFFDEANRVLDDAMATLTLPGVPAVDARPRLVETAPVEGLLRAATGADLLVVANRGIGAFGDLLVRSVSQGCVERAPCPVVVVPPAADHTTARGRIVVGVDGSTASADALQWAMAEARRRDADLGVVIAYHHHQLESPIGPPGAVDHDSVRKASEALADEMVEHAMGATVSPPETVEVTAVPGGAGHALVEAAQDADLLVVGSRGRSNVRSVLLGSVSRHCVHHAPCPVVVVRDSAASQRRPSP